MTVTGSCHCRAVNLELATQPVRTVECGCSICSKLGVLWAYYPPDDVRVSGPTESYVCNTRVIAFRRCRNCGCTTHWETLGTDFGRMGINARLIEGIDLAEIERRVIAGPGPEAFE